MKRLQNSGILHQSVLSIRVSKWPLTVRLDYLDPSATTSTVQSHDDACRIICDKLKSNGLHYFSQNEHLKMVEKKQPKNMRHEVHDNFTRQFTTVRSQLDSEYDHISEGRV